MNHHVAGLFAQTVATKCVRVSSAWPMVHCTAPNCQVSKALAHLQVILSTPVVGITHTQAEPAKEISLG